MIALAWLAATGFFALLFFWIVERDLEAFDNDEDLLPFFFSILSLFGIVLSFLGFCLQIQS